MTAFAPYEILQVRISALYRRFKQELLLVPGVRECAVLHRGRAGPTVKAEKSAAQTRDASRKRPCNTTGSSQSNFEADPGRCKKRHALLLARTQCAQAAGPAIREDKFASEIKILP